MRTTDAGPAVPGPPQWGLTMAMRDLLKKATVACAILILSGPARGEDIARPIPIAVADFDYSDTSGEPRDQREEHAARLQDRKSVV